MANITITGSNSYSAAKYGLNLSVEAGEALIGGYGCVIKSDGKAYHMGTTVQTGTHAVGFDGFAMRDYASGDAVTLIGAGNVVMLDGNAGLTPGTNLWVGATAGVPSDAKVAGTDQPIARAISSTSVRVLR